MEIPDLQKQIEDNNWKKTALKIINTLWKEKDSNIFHQPVDVESFDIPDYFEVVEEPMDFGTIRAKLISNIYETA